MFRIIFYLKLTDFIKRKQTHVYLLIGILCNNRYPQRKDGIFLHNLSSMQLLYLQNEIIN